MDDDRNLLLPDIPTGLSDDCFEEALVHLITERDNDLDRRNPTGEE